MHARELRKMSLSQVDGAIAPHRGDREIHPLQELAKLMAENGYGPVFIGPPASGKYGFAKTPK